MVTKANERKIGYAGRPPYKPPGAKPGVSNSKMRAGKTAKKMAKAAPAFIEDNEVDGATLEVIRESMRTARDAEMRIRDLSGVLADESKNLKELKFGTLPDLFAAAGVDRLGLPEEGNYNAYDAKLSPFYHASIAAGWDDDRRNEAFKILADLGAADLIKTTITVSLPREDRAKAKAVEAALKKLKVEYDIDLSVHSSTLTAFVREQIEEGGAVLPLEKLGATVGMQVKMTERKKK